MASNYPIVRLQRESAKGTRIKGKRKPFFPAKLPYKTQVERLGKKFDSAAKSILEWGKGIDVSIDPRAVAPDRALVFELIGSVVGFEDAAQAFGLEWLLSDRKKLAATMSTRKRIKMRIPRRHRITSSISQCPVLRASIA